MKYISINVNPCILVVNSLPSTHVGYSGGMDSYRAKKGSSSQRVCAHSPRDHTPIKACTINYCIIGVYSASNEGHKEINKYRKP